MAAGSRHVRQVKYEHMSALVAEICSSHRHLPILERLNLLVNNDNCYFSTITTTTLPLLSESP